ncbi:MAG: beta-ketoacyl-ACP synthase III [Rubricoccaceae bacterium]|nr:beta-ketoacyl-ACP synthase III [Rubricoccaceae bacterium]
MRTAAITAVGRYLPEDRLTNADLERLVDTSDEWIRTRTGIEERRILRDPDKATAFMATEAARELLEKRDLDPAELDAIIVCTVTPDMFFPSTACLVQAGLGAPNVWGFDVSAACCGFMFGLTTGARFVESGRYEKVLVIGADKMSTIVDYGDRTTCILFGDAAGAVLLEPSAEGYGVLDTVERIDGANWEALCMTGGGSLNPATHQTLEQGMHFLHQEGRAVYKEAIAGMADMAEQVMVRGGLTPDDVRYVVPHQANLRIIEATARRMGLPMEKVMVNIQRYGNTTSGTIPLCLYDWEHELRRGDNLVLVAFGGGFTWSAAHVRWAYDGAAVSRHAERPERHREPATA